MSGVSAQSPQLADSGFTADPFQEQSEHYIADNVADIVERTESFFMGGDRRAVLDEVSHFCQFSNNLVAVLAEAGVGKTSLVRQAIRELNDTALCCLVQSSVMTTALDVFQSVSRQVGVFIPDAASVSDIIAVLAQYQPTGTQQRVIIIVDDAHHLNDEVLQCFITLLQAQSTFNVHVLLVGDSSLLQRLDYLDKGEVLVYDITLCPFNVAELEDYLSFKLSAVGYQGVDAFDADAVQLIWNETRGIAVSVNHAARQRLLAHQSEDHRSLGLPINYMILLVLLLAALIMSLAYLGGDDEMDAPPVIEEEVRDVVEVPAESPSVVESVPNHIAVEQPVLVATEPVIEDVVDNTPVDALSIPQTVAEVAVAEPVAQAPVVQSIADKPAVIEPSISEPVVKPQVPISSQAQPAPVLSSSSADEKVVLRWPDEKYTLQVIAASQLASIEKFVAEQPNKDVLRIVSFERNSKPWYVVLVGVYDSVQQARSAIQALPSEQVKSNPWPRSIGEVRNKIIDFRRN